MRAYTVHCSHCRLQFDLLVYDVELAKVSQSLLIANIVTP